MFLNFMGWLLEYGYSSLERSFLNSKFQSCLSFKSGKETEESLLGISHITKYYVVSICFRKILKPGNAGTAEQSGGGMPPPQYF